MSKQGSPYGPDDSDKIVEIINPGELDPKHMSRTSDVMEQLARGMDKAYTHDIFGEVLFKTADGKYHIVVVEAEIVEPLPDYLKQLLEDAAERKET